MSDVSELLDRHIKLPGTYNLRDTGGYLTSDGRRTRWRTLLRSDSLHALPAESRRALLDLGVQTIVDLRRPAEILRQPNVFAALNEARYMHIPLYDDRAAAHIDYAADTLEDIYVNYLEHCQTQIRDVLRLIGAPESGPVLVHCLVGKDRTGISVGLALGAAGVPETTIADDYAPSGAHLAPMFAEWRQEMVARGEPMERFDRVSQSPREAMLHALEHLNTKYDGIPGYLRRIGLSAAEVQALREKIVEA